MFHCYVSITTYTHCELYIFLHQLFSIYCSGHNLKTLLLLSYFIYLFSTRFFRISYFIFRFSFFLHFLHTHFAIKKKFTLFIFVFVCSTLLFSILSSHLSLLTLFCFLFFYRKNMQKYFNIFFCCSSLVNYSRVCCIEKNYAKCERDKKKMYEQQQLRQKRSRKEKKI